MTRKRAKDTERVKPEQHLYRYNVTLHDTVYHCNYNKYLIHSFTKCGVWIYMSQHAEYQGKLKFINLNCTKKYACKTKEEAIVSFKARKNMQIRILSEQLKTAKAGLDMIYKGEDIRIVYK